MDSSEKDWSEPELELDRLLLLVRLIELLLLIEEVRVFMMFV